MIHHAGRFGRGELCSVMAMPDPAPPRSAPAPGGGPQPAGRAAIGTDVR
jgi:hypothetical protein